jgi:hypothetical protein
MQVCQNGHVITDLLRTCPDRALSHCDRCGSATIDRCLTCGGELPGALAVPGLQPIGARQPPRYCSTCGAAFPWTEQAERPKTEAFAVLERLLRRLPLAIRQLRSRHGNRPPFRVVDEKDLEDLLRALLPLHFDDVRPECRTPRYAACTRTDFLLAQEGIVLAVKLAQPGLAEQIQEDAAYYRQAKKCRTLVGFIYDPESTVREPSVLEASHSQQNDELAVRCVVGGPSR